MKLHRPEDTAAEAEVCAKLAEALGWTLQRTPEFCVYDAKAFDGGRLVALVEIKRRSFLWTDIAEAVCLSARKLAACIVEAEGAGVPFYFAVQDSAGEVRVAQLSRKLVERLHVIVGGRLGRNREQDTEPMVKVPIEKFEVARL